MNTISPVLRAVYFWFVLGTCVAAQTKVIKLRGTVRDASSKVAVSGAAVSASGDAARQSETTDDQGFFRMLLARVSPGDMVRLRVEKSGYAVYDEQVIASEEIPLTILLRRLSAPAPTHPGKAAGSGTPHEPDDPVTARYIEELKDDHISVCMNALQVLMERAPQDTAAMSAVIAAALHGDYRVRRQAAYDIGELQPRSKKAVTNLLIDLHDADSWVRDQAVQSLGSFPKDKEAMATLLGLLGTPPSIDERALHSLIRSGITDPQVSKAVFYEATLGDKASVQAMERLPLTADLASRLSAELVKSLDSPITSHSQGIVQILLKGDPSHMRLREVLASLDSYRQSRLVLAWLEVDHSAKVEILQIVPAAKLLAELDKQTEKLGVESVSLDYPVFHNGDNHDCNFGVQLRRAMGVLVLDLETRSDAMKTFAYALSKESTAWDSCRAYAVIVIGWLSPAQAKPIVPLIVKGVQCFQGGGSPIAPLDLVQDTLASVGDESTIVFLQRTPEQKQAYCGDNDQGWLKESEVSNLIARIRSRKEH